MSPPDFKTLEINALESTRFGIIAGRLTDPHASPEVINTEAARLKLDMLTSRLSVDALDRVQALQSDGHQLMDTLVYYARTADDLPPAPSLPAGLSLRAATPQDAAEVAAIARDAFENYMGHYHADPRLDNAAADAAYVEWAETAIGNPGAGYNILATLHGTPAGFMTLRTTQSPEDISELEIVLNAVSPRAQGHGIYGAMIHTALRHAQTVGAARIIVSTQINNYAVQRVWARQGFSLFTGYYTLHKWYT